MSRALLDRVVVPVADSDDARATADALGDYECADVIAIHIIEKGGGTPDKIPMEQAEQRAEAAFEAFRDVIPDAETEIAYNTHVVDGVFEVAAERSASAIAFQPRGGSRLTQFLEGDPALKLVTGAERPVIALPEEHDE